MVDLAMMVRVFRALPRHTKVVLLGDADQLPSVAVGNVLADLAPRPHQGYSAINRRYLAEITGFEGAGFEGVGFEGSGLESSGLENKDLEYSRLVNQQQDLTRVDEQTNEYYPLSDCVTFLTKSRRFDSSGGIGQLAQYVISGQYQPSWQLLINNVLHTEQITSQANSDISAQTETADLRQITLYTDDIAIWLPTLVKQYYQPLSECKDIKQAFALLNKFRILSPTRKGQQGVDNINNMVMDILRQLAVIPFRQELYASKPIMISENDYRLGLYNGDIGLLWYNDKGQLMAVFENENAQFSWFLPSRLPKFTTVYAMTIHKTQGSEFDHVAMVLPDQKDNAMLTRELLYTGITRAKAKISIASQAEVWQKGVSQRTIRYSGLFKH